MDSARRSGMPVDDMPAGEWIVQSRREAAFAGNPHCFQTERRIGSAAAAVTKHDRRNTGWRRRHRMAVEQDRAAETVEKQPQQFVDCAMVRPMRLIQALFELTFGDRASPQETVSRRAAGYDAKAAARTSRQAFAAPPLDHRRID